MEALPALLKKVKEKEAEIKSLQQERITLERDLKKLLEDMVEKAEVLKGEHEGKIKMEQRRDLLRQRKLELEIIGIQPLEYTTNESLDQVFEKIQLYNKDREILKAGKDSKFDLLRFNIIYAYFF